MEASRDGRDRTEILPTVLVAIEPRAYREAVGKAIEMSRPNLSVRIIESGMLDAELSRTNPMLVLCNGTVEPSVDGVPNWVVFRGDESDSAATVDVDGTQSEVERFDLDDLLRIVDRVTPSTRDESRRPENKEL